ncbi:glutathione synthase [Porticoccaceae bacterium]|jgi:glutathione synthase|nr:glutathione synthase [Porticoccaceae bacterium]MDB9843142.1 glutathione synthase [Porticoccaceae bacterium]CAI8313005.1 MAG: Glutathione synthetase [SAR92 bacterium MED-G29]|tara:strand:+ start:8236 stop:9186 length:951 start_codon:yes stop_codon:yes gene_type:complete
MGKSLGVVMDPIQSIKYNKDTTLSLLLAAQRQGFKLFYMEQRHLFLQDGDPRAEVRPLTVFEDENKWYELGGASSVPLEELDVILMRKDPPFDAEFIYSTYILEAAERRGTLVVNKPQSLRDCNEKVFATQFPQCTPPLLVSRDQNRLKNFLAEHGDVVFKPLDGMGGTSIFRVREGDQNLNVILETITKYGEEMIMAQKYLPEILTGDKRILVVDGEVVPYSLARIPSEGEFRGNLAAGGYGVVQPLTDRDRWIAEQIAPTLIEKGLIFVGLDVIGDYLTEINVTSPTCVREIDDAQGTAIGDMLMAAINTRLKQ